MAQENNPDLIAGVEWDIIEKFLFLIRDKYPLADKANYFLELNLGQSGINIAITNQRDVLSHLSTILTNSSLTYEQKLGQISTAEEHLRRAVIDTYQKALALKLENMEKIYADYKIKVLPLKANHNELSSAPDMVSVKAILDQVASLREKGRNAKQRNIWDLEWEKGIEYFLEAFTKVKDLERQLEEYIIKAAQITFSDDQRKKSQSQSFWAKWGVFATIITFILGFFIKDIFCYLKTLFQSKSFP